MHWQLQGSYLVVVALLEMTGDHSYWLVEIGNLLVLRAAFQKSNQWTQRSRFALVAV